MRFTCNREQLAEVLGLLNEVAPAKAVKPVLQNVRIRGNDDGTISLAATDLEIALEYVLEVSDLRDPETVLLPAIRLAGLVRESWEPTLEIDIENDRAKIRSGKNTFELPGTPPDEYPPLPDFPGENVVEIAGNDLIDAVRKTIFAAARGDTRYALNGILLHIEGGNAQFVSSDTHRLSLVTKPLAAPASKVSEAIIITRGMNVLSKLAANEETVKLHVGARQLQARTSRGVLISNIVDGQFPRYREVIPKTLEKRVTVDRDLLSRSLRQVGQVSNEETHAISFQATGDTLVLNASGGESGQGRAVLPAEVHGEDLSISFNYLYILDLIKVLSHDGLTLQLHDSENPGKVEEGDFVHVLMPIRSLGGR